MNTQPVVIAGAGIAGLTIAYELQQQGIPYVVMEAGHVSGGMMRSLYVDGYELDAGPNTIAATPATIAYFRALGLEEDLMEASAVSKNRFLVRDNKLHAVSPHPLKIIKSKYISGGAKWRLFTEQFRSKALKISDVSVAAFVKRRFGQEIADYLFDPVLAGIYAGDPDKLSVQEVLPMLPKWEQEYGSVTKGLMKNKEMMGGRKIVAFKTGNVRLTERLTSALNTPVRFNCAITGIARGADDYIVQYTENGQTAMFNASRIILTTPAHITAQLIGTLDEKTAGMLKNIHYPHMGALHLGFGEEALSKAPEGFGFLVPHVENKHFLGAICNTAIFPSRSPKGKVLYTVFMGGARQEHYFHELDIEQWQQLVVQELMGILGLQTPPEMQHFSEWEKAIPQFNVGYGAIRGQIAAFEQRFPGIRLGGNYVSGVAVPAIIQAAKSFIK